MFNYSVCLMQILYFDSLIKAITHRKKNLNCNVSLVYYWLLNMLFKCIYFEAGCFIYCQYTAE